MDREPGLSVRLKLTLSYAAFLVLAGALLLALWAVLFHFYSRSPLVQTTRAGIGGAFYPGRSPAQSAFGEAGIAVLGFLLLFGLVGGWFLAGRMLAPLARITDATRTAATGSLSHRIELPGRRDEFRELADSFDTMLARLEGHLDEQRRFAANASHELRTPLAITKTLLEAARNDPDRDPVELNDRLRVVNDRAIDLTEAMLLLSLAERRAFTPEPLDLSLIAEEAAETLLPFAARRDITIEVSGDVAPSVGSPTLLLQMTTNLVQNAIVHNLPEHGTVCVRTSLVPGSVVLTVENTGDKLTPQVVATLREPFQRGSNRARTDHAGAGLGLAIVNSITQAHDGTLTLTPRAAGGLTATVRLPAEPPAVGPSVRRSSPR